MGPQTDETSELSGKMSRASQASLEAQWVSRAQGPGCEMLDGPEILRVFTGAPSQSLNCVTRAKFEEREADARIRETHDYFRSKGVPMIWWVGPYSTPSDLGERLLAHGAERLEHDLPAMAVDLRRLNDSASAPDGLEIEHVTDAEGLRRFVSAFAGGTGSPDDMSAAFLRINAGAGYGRERGWRHYVGVLSGEPVATASLHLSDGVAGINAVGTAPKARRLGIGTAVTLAALRYAKARGYRTGALKSSDMAYGMYRRMGFEEYYKYAIYAWRA